MSDFYELKADRTIEGPFGSMELIRRSPKSGLTKRIEYTRFRCGMVSTVFLGLDHSYSGDELILFETMCTGKYCDWGYQTRYVTYDEALKGHGVAVKWYKKLFKRVRRIKKRMRRG